VGELRARTAPRYASAVRSRSASAARSGAARLQFLLALALVLGGAALPFLGRTRGGAAAEWAGHALVFLVFLVFLGVLWPLSAGRLGRLLSGLLDLADRAPIRPLEIRPVPPSPEGPRLDAVDRPRPPRARRRGGVVLRLVAPLALILAGLGLVFLGFGGAPRLVAFAGFGLMGVGTAAIVFLGPTEDNGDGPG